MHDRTTLAWLIVLAYAAGAVLALAAMQSSSERRERRFWLAAALLLALLGLNKQLDLQSVMVEQGRDLARAQGWYAARRSVQGAFLLVLAGGAAVIAALLGAWLSGADRRVKTAAAGVLLLLAFVLIRAASFHHVDRWVTIDVAGLRSGWWLELAGIFLFSAAAVAFRNHGRRRREP